MLISPIGKKNAEDFQRSKKRYTISMKITPRKKGRRKIPFFLSLSLSCTPSFFLSSFRILARLLLDRHNNPIYDSCLSVPNSLPSSSFSVFVCLHSTLSSMSPTPLLSWKKGAKKRKTAVKPPLEPNQQHACDDATPLHPPPLSLSISSPLRCSIFVFFLNLQPSFFLLSCPSIHPSIREIDKLNSLSLVFSFSKADSSLASI